MPNTYIDPTLEAALSQNLLQSGIPVKPSGGWIVKSVRPGVNQAISPEEGVEVIIDDFGNIIG